VSGETAAGAVQPMPDARRSGCRKADAGRHHAYAGRYIPDKMT